MEKHSNEYLRRIKKSKSISFFYFHGTAKYTQFISRILYLLCLCFGHKSREWGKNSTIAKEENDKST